MEKGKSNPQPTMTFAVTSCFYEGIFLVKQVLIIGDPLTTLKPATDTSLALAEIALKKNYEVFWCEPQDIVFWNQSIHVVRPTVMPHTHIHESFNRTEGLKPLADFSLIFVRKDPPFDTNYHDLCWILASQNKVPVINRAEALLRFHEKSLPWHAATWGILDPQSNLVPTCLSEEWDVVESFCKTHSGPFVCKPWLGHAGSGVQLCHNVAEVKEAFFNRKEKLLVQPCLEEIHTQGDRRVFLINGKIAFHFVRFPPSDSVISNTARGGRAELCPLEGPLKTLCENLAQFLWSQGIFMAGLDIIGNRIGEINITSPTGIKIYEQLTGQNHCDTLLGALIP